MVEVQRLWRLRLDGCHIQARAEGTDKEQRNHLQAHTTDVFNGCAGEVLMNLVLLLSEEGLLKKPFQLAPGKTMKHTRNSVRSFHRNC